LADDKKGDTPDGKKLIKITPKRPQSRAANANGFVAQAPVSAPRTAVKK
jgi:hypothetical protein